MVVTEMIDKDYNDINSLISLIDVFKASKILKEDFSVMPFIYELKDILDLYWYIKEEAVYNQIRDKIASSYDQVKLFESYRQLSLLLGRCIRTLERRETVKGVVQFEILANLLKHYLNEEMQYLLQTLEENFSNTELKDMAMLYEAKKINYPSLACAGVGASIPRGRSH
jgi:hypothetical protein